MRSARRDCLANRGRRADKRAGGGEGEGGEHGRARFGGARVGDRWASHSRGGVGDIKNRTTDRTIQEGGILRLLGALCPPAGKPPPSRAARTWVGRRARRATGRSGLLGDAQPRSWIARALRFPELRQAACRPL
eukprot:scaffold2000_cov86-Isochrysis_galbana.AAC.2